MARKDHPLFYLDADRRYRLSCDDLQWIIERGNPEHVRPGKDSGYRGISFVLSDKDILRRCMREKNIKPSLEAEAYLAALPYYFLEFRDLVRALGIDGFRKWLHDRAEALKSLPEASQAAGEQEGKASGDVVSKDASSSLPVPSRDPERDRSLARRSKVSRPGAVKLKVSGS